MDVLSDADIMYVASMIYSIPIVSERKLLFMFLIIAHIVPTLCRWLSRAHGYHAFHFSYFFLSESNLNLYIVHISVIMNHLVDLHIRYDRFTSISRLMNAMHGVLIHQIDHF